MNTYCSILSATPMSHHSKCSNQTIQRTEHSLNKTGTKKEIEEKTFQSQWRRFHERSEYQEKKSWKTLKGTSERCLLPATPMIREIINGHIRDTGCRKVKYQRRQNKSHSRSEVRGESVVPSRLSEPSGQNCTIRTVRPPWANQRPYLPFYQRAGGSLKSTDITCKRNTCVCIRNGHT